MPMVQLVLIVPPCAGRGACAQANNENVPHRERNVFIPSHWPRGTRRDFYELVKPCFSLSTGDRGVARNVTRAIEKLPRDLTSAAGNSTRCASDLRFFLYPFFFSFLPFSHVRLREPGEPRPRRCLLFRKIYTEPLRRT